MEISKKEKKIVDLKKINAFVVKLGPHEPMITSELVQAIGSEYPELDGKIVQLLQAYKAKNNRIVIRGIY